METMEATETRTSRARRALARAAFAAALAAVLAGVGASALPAAAAGCGACDDDGDGLLNNDEVFVYGTDLADWDTDGDLYGDGEEVYQGSDPLFYDYVVVRSDSDGDGLYDEDEWSVYGTDAYAYDTDGDGHNDGAEVFYGTNPLGPGCGGPCG